MFYLGQVEDFRYIKIIKEVSGMFFLRSFFTNKIGHPSICLRGLIDGFVADELVHCHRVFHNLKCGYGRVLGPNFQVNCFFCILFCFVLFWVVERDEVV